jgi:hypothetical protein
VVKSSGLGYGNRSAGKIPAGLVLIFEVEWFEIQSSREESEIDGVRVNC